MRHRIGGTQFSMDTQHRKAMLRNLAAGLFEHGQVETTIQKAKAVQPMVEKIITIAKKGGLSSRRLIARKLNDRKIHVWVADPNVKDWKKDNQFFDLPDAGDIEFNRYGETRKAPRLIQHIMAKVAPMFADRDGGYTRIIKTGRHRLGDASDVVILQLVGKEEGPELGGGDSKRRARGNKRTAFAEKLGNGGTASGTGSEVQEVEMTEDQIARAKAQGAEVIEVEEKG